MKPPLEVGEIVIIQNRPAEMGLNDREAVVVADVRMRKTKGRGGVEQQERMLCIIRMPDGSRFFTGEQYLRRKYTGSSEPGTWDECVWKPKHIRGN